MTTDTFNTTFSGHRNSFSPMSATIPARLWEEARASFLGAVSDWRVDPVTARRDVSVTVPPDQVDEAQELLDAAAARLFEREREEQSAELRRASAENLLAEVGDDVDVEALADLVKIVRGGGSARYALQAASRTLPRATEVALARVGGYEPRGVYEVVITAKIARTSRPTPGDVTDWVDSLMDADDVTGPCGRVSLLDVTASVEEVDEGL